MRIFSVSTRARTKFVDITKKIAKAVTSLDIKEGVITVFIPCATAGVRIDDTKVCVSCSLS